MIMARYGPIYLLRGPSGSWHTCWSNDAHDELAMESYLIDDGMDGPSCFSTRREALREILRSLDSEIEAGGVGYVGERQRARDSLILSTNEEDPSAVPNEFSGTLAETQLIEAWMGSDRYEAHVKATAAKRHAAHVAACAEQGRRERVFEQIVMVFGNQVVEEINAAIKRAWLEQPPRSRRTAHGQKAGEVMPMPQLAIASGRAAFYSPGRAKPLPVRTPLSAPDMRYGHKNHWQHPTWVDIVIPAVAQIIDRFEQDAPVAPLRVSKGAELP
ncbi:hypothetical protein SRABI118_04535 [Massilia sp. Bi118]|nr:hypothetical protein SRABI118_04535 [Massilia sp. Bi118]